MTGGMEKAACRAEDVDPEWWAHTPGLAVHICRSHCPVRAKCDAEAEGHQWSGLVIGGYLRTEGSTRSQVQPVEKTDGCPTCRPETVPKERARNTGELPTATCSVCGRSVKAYRNGKPIRHKNFVDGAWAWCA